MNNLAQIAKCLKGLTGEQLKKAFGLFKAQGYVQDNSKQYGYLGNGNKSLRRRGFMARQITACCDYSPCNHSFDGEPGYIWEKTEANK